MKEDKILSICISTYNRKASVIKMVKEILAINNARFNVWVVDDCSVDGTVEELKSIRDERLSVVSNVENLGAKANWYETLNCGNGKFLLHVLDRDLFNVRFLPRVIEILEQSNEGFGYIGNYYARYDDDKRKETIAVYSKGEEALYEYACTLVHPSGFLIRKTCWDALEDKKKFFLTDEYGIYPHSYLYTLLAGSESGIAIRYDMFTLSRVSNMGKNRSKFYQKSKTSYWWTRDSIEYELLSALKFILMNIEVNDNVKSRLLLYVYEEQLNRATIMSRKTHKNIEHVKHYNQEVIYISYDELDKINMEMTQNFLRNVNMYGSDIYNVDFVDRVHRIAERNRYAIHENEDVNQTILEKEKMITKFESYYLMMDAWLQLRQKEIYLSYKLKEMGLCRIAIYGNGKMGKRLYEELKNSDVEVVYYIDKKAASMMEDIPVFSLEQVLPKVDAIIVSLSEYYNCIKKDLNKVCEYPVYSLDNIIYESFEI